MLRQNGEPSAYKAAVSCYSGGRFEHCVISLVEDVDKKGAKWVFRGMPQDEVRVGALRGFAPRREREGATPAVPSSTFR